MHALIRNKLVELTELCGKHSVKRLDIFGSAVQGSFDSDRSDLDFLIEFLPSTPAEHYERYFGMVEDLEALFGVRVDLVEAAAMRNPVFIKRVQTTRETLYAA